MWGGCERREARGCDERFARQVDSTTTLPARAEWRPERPLTARKANPPADSARVGESSGIQSGKPSLWFCGARARGGASQLERDRHATWMAMRNELNLQVRGSRDSSFVSGACASQASHPRPLYPTRPTEAAILVSSLSFSSLGTRAEVTDPNACTAFTRNAWEGGWR